jgi:hypothetical protein
MILRLAAAAVAEAGAVAEEAMKERTHWHHL